MHPHYVSLSHFIWLDVFALLAHHLHSDSEFTDWAIEGDDTGPIEGADTTLR